MSEFIDIAMGLLIIEMMAILFQIVGVIVLASVVAICRVMTRVFQFGMTRILR